jgi:hypothetical protein
MQVLSRGTITSTTQLRFKATDNNSAASFNGIYVDINTAVEVIDTAKTESGISFVQVQPCGGRKKGWLAAEYYATFGAVGSAPTEGTSTTNGGAEALSPAGRRVSVPCTSYFEGGDKSGEDSDSEPPSIPPTPRESSGEGSCSELDGESD